MEVICLNCKTRLNIPDEKLPPGQKLHVTCPKCKGKIPLRAQDPGPRKERPRKERPPKPEPLEKAGGYDYGDEDPVLDLYEHGTKLALVMEQDQASAERVKEAVEGLGYRFVPALSTREAVGKMRFHLFELVILSDRFDDIELVQSPILHYLNHLSMSIRRRMFVALLGDAFKTLDQMMAFALSVNLVINRADLDKLDLVLKKAVGDNEQFYKVFMDTLAELGKV